MKDRSSFNSAEFDEYAAGYDASLAHGLSVSGEDKNYFARGRIAWLAGCLRKLGEQPRWVMDFGSGTGSAVPFWRDLFKLSGLLCVDNSARALDLARQMYGCDRTQFLSTEQYQPRGAIDLAYCNGVFHHIPPAERPAAVNYVYRSLRSDGLFSFWENNPWNPGTRYVMTRIPFDRNAKTLSVPQSRRLLRAGGFKILRTDFLFIFPSVLRWFRFIEPAVSRFPFGAQYQVLCRKP
jgi:SAM-dependent methyltransferase